MKTAIITDSTVFLKEEYRQRENLFILSVPLIIGNRLFREGIDIESTEFYDLLKQENELPKTSQPSVGEVLELYEDVINQGYDHIISIHLSSEISGFTRTVQSLASELTHIKISVFDSKLTTGPMGKLVETALDLCEKKVEIEEIIERLEMMRQHLNGYIVVDDLNHLVRGGRLKNGAAILGTLLKIKPILYFEDGAIVLKEKIRSQKKALARIQAIALNEQYLSADQLTFYVIHCNNSEIAQRVEQDLLKEDKDLDTIICEFGPVIGAHLGEKAVAIGVAPKSIEDLII
ncbi:DegV family protein [Vagococcus sp.]|uniref:DegV family protein n=1 Tax=Vagococcus sp. TaxID=1933889 RepID=UPI003F96DCA0